MSNAVLYPSVLSIPVKPAIADKQLAQATESSHGVLPTESFNQILGSEFTRPVVEPLKFSAHAAARLQSRNLSISQDEMRKLNEAVQKAATKGLDDTLVLTKDNAFIVSVKNRTVVTALDRNMLSGAESKVFTNIDGAVVIN